MRPPQILVCQRWQSAEGPLSPYINQGQLICYNQVWEFERRQLLCVSAQPSFLQHTLRSTKLATHWTPNSATCTLYTACIKLHTVYCYCTLLLLTAHCTTTLHTLYTSKCKLHTAHCTLYTANCKLSTSNVILYTKYIKVNFTLYTTNTEKVTLDNAH